MKANIKILLFIITLWVNHFAIGQPATITSLGYFGSYVTGNSPYTSLAIDKKGVPYVAFQDGDFYINGTCFSTNYATVMKLDSVGINWMPVGSPGFTACSETYNSLAIDSKGIPYVAYSDEADSFKVSVMSYVNNDWQYVGKQGFTVDHASQVSLVINGNDVPFVAYSNNGYINVMKFIDSNWVQVGTPILCNGREISFAIDQNGVPFIATNCISGVINPLSVFAYKDSSWLLAGNKIISQGAAGYLSLAIGINNTPLVAYMDIANKSKISVQKYDGNNWNYVGNVGFSNPGESISLTIDSNGVPYIAFCDAGYLGGASVMSYNGNTWEYVGYPDISNGFTFNMALKAKANGDLILATGFFSPSAYEIKLDKTVTRLTNSMASNNAESFPHLVAFKINEFQL